MNMQSHRLKFFAILLILLLCFNAKASEINLQTNSSGHVAPVSGANYDVENCEMNISGSTLTIRGANHQALSTTNPCKIGVKSTTNGNVAVVSFTSNVTVSFGSSSDTDGNLFNITEANWSYPMPMFIGVIYDGTSAYFTLSRHNFTKTSSGVEFLCQKGDTDCDTDDVMILATGLTLSSWTSKQITQVGWLRATYSTSTTAWSLSSAPDIGFNFNFEKFYWRMPTGQMGAVSGSYLYSYNGADTIPSVIDALYYYQVDRSGVCKVMFYLGGDNGTDGSGSGELRIPMPYTVVSGNVDYPTGIYSVKTPSVYKTGALTAYQSSFLVFPYESSGAPVSMTPGDFTNGDRVIRGSFSYRIQDYL